MSGLCSNFGNRLMLCQRLSLCILTLRTSWISSYGVPATLSVYFYSAHILDIIPLWSIHRKVVWKYALQNLVVGMSLFIWVFWTTLVNNPIKHTAIVVKFKILSEKFHFGCNYIIVLINIEMLLNIMQEFWRGRYRELEISLMKQKLPINWEDH